MTSSLLSFPARSNCSQNLQLQHKRGYHTFAFDSKQIQKLKGSNVSMSTMSFSSSTSESDSYYASNDVPKAETTQIHIKNDEAAKGASHHNRGSRTTKKAESDNSSDTDSGSDSDSDSDSDDSGAESESELDVDLTLKYRDSNQQTNKNKNNNKKRKKNAKKDNGGKYHPKCLVFCAFCPQSLRDYRPTFWYLISFLVLFQFAILLTILLSFFLDIWSNVILISVLWTVQLLVIIQLLWLLISNKFQFLSHLTLFQSCVLYLVSIIIFANFYLVIHHWFPFNTFNSSTYSTLISFNIQLRNASAYASLYTPITMVCELFLIFLYYSTSQQTLAGVADVKPIFTGVVIISGLQIFVGIFLAVFIISFTLGNTQQKQKQKKDESQQRGTSGQNNVSQALKSLEMLLTPRSKAKVLNLETQMGNTHELNTHHFMLEMKPISSFGGGGGGHRTRSPTRTRMRAQTVRTPGLQTLNLHLLPSQNNDDFRKKKNKKKNKKKHKKTQRQHNSVEYEDEIESEFNNSNNNNETNPFQRKSVTMGSMTSHIMDDLEDSESGRANESSDGGRARCCGACSCSCCQTVCEYCAHWFRDLKHHPIICHVRRTIRRFLLFFVIFVQSLKAIIFALFLTIKTENNFEIVLTISILLDIILIGVILTVSMKFVRNFYYYLASDTKNTNHVLSISISFLIQSYLSCVLLFVGLYMDMQLYLYHVFKMNAFSFASAGVGSGVSGVRGSSSSNQMQMILQFLYFSLSTMTLCGSNVIQPQSWFPILFACLEMVVGLFFHVIIFGYGLRNIKHKYPEIKAKKGT